MCRHRARRDRPPDSELPLPCKCRRSCNEGWSPRVRSRSAQDSTRRRERTTLNGSSTLTKTFVTHRASACGTLEREAQRFLSQNTRDFACIHRSMTSWTDRRRYRGLNPETALIPHAQRIWLLADHQECTMADRDMLVLGMQALHSQRVAASNAQSSEFVCPSQGADGDQPSGVRNRRSGCDTALPRRRTQRS